MCKQLNLKTGSIKPILIWLDVKATPSIKEVV